jgi:hypothetical protein
MRRPSGRGLSRGAHRPAGLTADSFAQRIQEGSKVFELDDPVDGASRDAL